jgi:hypothetical protein
LGVSSDLQNLHSTLLEAKQGGDFGCFALHIQMMRMD